MIDTISSSDPHGVGAGGQRGHINGQEARFRVVCLELMTACVERLRDIHSALGDNVLIVPPAETVQPDGDGYDEVSGVEMECIDAEFGDYAPRAKDTTPPDIFGLGWWLDYVNDGNEWWDVFQEMKDGSVQIECEHYLPQSRFVQLWHKCIELREQRDMMLERWQGAERRASEQCECNGECAKG